MLNKIKKVWRAVKQKYGTTRVKSRLWDQEYSSGRWDNSKKTVWPELYDLIGRYSKGGSILDLGCGPGATANELPENYYSFYLGVDISSVAIKEAVERSEKNHRAKNRFIQSDISEYMPDRSFNVVLLRESIYYLSNPGLVLSRLANSLADAGVFIAVIAKSQKYEHILKLIHHNYRVLETHSLPSDTSSIIVFSKSRS